MNKDLELEVTHMTLLGMHTAKLGDGTGLAVLLKWNGLPEYEATWDDFSLLSHPTTLWSLSYFSPQRQGKV